MNKITKENIIKMVADKSNHTIKDTKTFYDALEEVVFEQISSVDESEDIRLKLFEGITLDGKFIHEKEKKNNLTGKVNLVPSHIKPKFNITDTYCKKINNK